MGEGNVKLNNLHDIIVHFTAHEAKLVTIIVRKSQLQYSSPYLVVQTSPLSFLFSVVRLGCHIQILVV